MTFSVLVGAVDAQHGDEGSGQGHCSTRPVRLGFGDDQLAAAVPEGVAHTVLLTALLREIGQSGGARRSQHSERSSKSMYRLLNTLGTESHPFVSVNCPTSVMPLRKKSAQPVRYRR